MITEMESFSDDWKIRSNRMEEKSGSSSQASFPLNASCKMREKRKSVSSEEGKEENSDVIADRRLTIHCIVEEVTSLEADRWKECPYNCNNPSKTSKENSKWWLCECRKIEMNSCVVIKASTSMNELVKTVLTKLGYPGNASSSATGSILIRNWKALSLSSICPSPKMTVGDMLGELSTLATLQIQILRPKSAFLQEMKDKLLSFLITKNHTLLSNSGCPLDLLMLSKLCEETVCMKKQLKEEPSEEMQQRFEVWLNHVQKTELNSELADRGSNNQNNVRGTGKICGAEKPVKLNGSAGGNAGSGNGSNGPVLCVESPSVIVCDKDRNKDAEGCVKTSSPNFEVQERTIHCPQAKTRMRTSFDPDLELPKLLKWYLENPHPTRQQIHEYVQELNSLESRRGRKKLDMNNVVYWFKNARAAQKRSEYRKFCNIPVSGAKKSCSELKIPLGKSSSIASDEHVTLSDDEPPAATESENTFRSGNGKCMQVLGNWNSNGAGEAVLEMQITPKSCQPVSPIKVEEETGSDHEDSSREGMLSIAEESVDNMEQDSPDENHRLPPGESKENPFEMVDSDDKEQNEVEIRQSDDEIRSNGERNYAKKGQGEEMVNSKSQNSFGSHKKLNGFNHSDNSLLSRYKTVSQNSILRHSFMYMSQCMNSKLSNIPLSSEERRKRNRTFIDPLTEVPRLEQWFQLSTHPSHSLIVRYTEELNGMPYRRKFPKLETKNVQFWFKNRRAKNKRLNYLDTNNFLR